MSAENVEAVRSSLRGWNRGDFEAWSEGAHPEIEWVSAVIRQVEGSETVHRGREGLRRYWDEWHSVWDVKVDVADIHDAGDSVVATGRLLTRGGASGVDLDSPIAFVFEFEDGLARRVRAHLDPREALEAAGLGDRSGAEWNVEIVRRVTDAINAGEFLSDLVAPDVELKNATTAVTDASYVGREGALKWRSDMFDVVAGARLEIEEVLAAGADHVVVANRIGGSGSSSGAPVELRWVSVFWLRDGKVARIAGYTNRHDALEAVGIRKQTTS
jgi:ketosteroid isomerase-like protein